LQNPIATHPVVGAVIVTEIDQLANDDAFTTFHVTPIAVDAAAVESVENDCEPEVGRGGRVGPEKRVLGASVGVGLAVVAGDAVGADEPDDDEPGDTEPGLPDEGTETATSNVVCASAG
jgi:hypothetical protein